MEAGTSAPAEDLPRKSASERDALIREALKIRADKQDVMNGVDEDIRERLSEAVMRKLEKTDAGD